MNIKQYQKEALKTAIYKKSKTFPGVYPLLGMCGEFIEFLLVSKPSVKDSQNIKKEAGDFFWYVVVFWHDMGFDIELLETSIANPSKPSLTFSTNIFEAYKKLVRDDNTDKLEEIKTTVFEAMAMVLNELNSLDVSLENVLETNIIKLKDRQERNAIKGDGDNR